MWEYDDGFQRVRRCFGKFPIDFRLIYIEPADSGCIRLCCFPSDFQPEFEIRQCVQFYRSGKWNFAFRILPVHWYHLLCL